MFVNTNILKKNLGRYIVGTQNFSFIQVIQDKGLVIKKWLSKNDNENLRVNTENQRLQGYRKHYFVPNPKYLKHTNKCLSVSKYDQFMILFSVFQYQWCSSQTKESNAAFPSKTDQQRYIHQTQQSYHQHVENSRTIHYMGVRFPN